MGFRAGMGFRPWASWLPRSVHQSLVNWKVPLKSPRPVEAEDTALQSHHTACQHLQAASGKPRPPLRGAALAGTAQVQREHVNRPGAPAGLLVCWQSSSRAGPGGAGAGVRGAGPGSGHWGPRATPAALILFQCILVPFLDSRILSKTQRFLGSFSAAAARPHPTARGTQAAGLRLPLCHGAHQPPASQPPVEHSRQAHGLQGGHHGGNAHQGPLNPLLPGLGAPLLLPSHPPLTLPGVSPYPPQGSPPPHP